MSKDELIKFAQTNYVDDKHIINGYVLPRFFSDYVDTNGRCAAIGQYYDIEDAFADSRVLHYKQLGYEIRILNESFEVVHTLTNCV